MSATARDNTGTPCGGRSARFHRFTTRNRCPHCDHDGPCIYFDNGDVLCHREGEPGNWTDSFIGGYWHRALGTTGHQPVPRRLPSPSTPPITPADLTLRNAVYADLLRLCPLSQDQRAAHQLTDAQAHRYGWLPSDPADQARIVTALLDTYTREELLGVPGFRAHNGHITIRGGDMMMLPTRDLDRQIHAIDLRREVVQPKQSRYVKLSSRTDGDEDAPSPGAPAHVALPAGGVTVDGVIGVTEGVKKADYAADALGYPVVSIPGVGSWRAAVGVIERFAGNVVVLMLDEDDPQKNEGRTVAAVERAQTAIAAAAVSLGYAVRLATWDHTHAKGIDDLLAAGRTFTLERYTRPADESGHGAGLLTHATEDGILNVDPRFLAWLIKETAATATLRARYHRVQAILADPIMNDGQKLVTIALTSRLARPRANGEPVEPTKVCAGTIARDLGSKLTLKDGKERPTKLNTVTKNLADIVTLGVCTREEIHENRVITKQDDRGHTYEKDVKTTSFRYSDTLSLPGEHIKREDAKDVPTRAKIDRERPRRCPHCFSTHLKPASHVCLDCDTVSSDVHVVEAGQMIDDRGNGLFVHRETAEVIVPGVPAYDGDFGAAATPDETQYRNPVSGQTPPSPVAHGSSHADPIPESGYFSTSERGYRNPVSGQRVTSTMNGAAPTSLKPCAGGCGTLTAHGWECKSCRERPTDGALHSMGHTTTPQEAMYGS